MFTDNLNHIAHISLLAVIIVLIMAAVIVVPVTVAVVAVINGGKSTQISYLSKSSSDQMLKYCVIS